MNDKQWNNRIIGYKQIPVSDLLANPANARRHPAAQRDALRGSLDTLGWVAPVIYNTRTQYLVDGHARVEELLTKDDSALIPVIEVDLSEDEEKLFLASFDWITQLANYDRDSLDSLLQAVNTDNENLQTMLAGMAGDHELYETLRQIDPDNALLQELNDGLYSREIESPIYEPTREKPSISDLYNDDRTTQLITDINASGDLSEEEKQFLIIAAQRHTVLNFSKIADYYAHSAPLVQNLMEDSALVIIDFNRAIELGFVKLTKEIAHLYEKDYPDE